MNKYTQLALAILFLIAAGAASCEFSLRQNNQNEGLTARDVDTSELQKAGVTTSQNLFSDFLEMVDDVRNRSQSEIDSLSNSEIFQLAESLQKTISNTIFYNDGTLQKLSEPLRNLSENVASLPERNHATLSRQIEEVLQSGSNSADGPRPKNARELRQILKSWASDSDTSTACGDLFNQHEDYVLIGEGENLNIANFACPAGSIFIIRNGVYAGQSVLQSKDRNSWIGLRQAILDGENSVYRAFSGGMNQNRIGWIAIRNYHLHGVYSKDKTSGVLLKEIHFMNIAPDSSGQYFGAIQFDNARDITVRESVFENVASGVRLRFSRGPLQVTHNEALNSGRNFFQCDDCNGGGIRISNNSLVRANAYGADTLEDWINLYKSSGDSTDWIQVNHNRAKGHSLSGSGSFIMLGDAGGMYQEAIGNIGVNPGQVGIGIAGGHHVKVEANKMYSTAWDSSNVAFYSANYSPSCGNHVFPGAETSEPNRANWICGDEFNCNPPAMNHAWTDGKCGISNSEIRENIIIDRSLTPDVWNEW